MNRVPVAFIFVLLMASVCYAEPQTYRLYQGLTLYVNNPTGKAFDVNLDVRDLNFFSGVPREMLLKVYDPEGRTPVREYIPDDGVAGKGFLPRLGG